MYNLKGNFLIPFLLLWGILTFGQQTYSDNFSSVSYTNNDGTANFSSNWIESGETTNPSNGRITIATNQLRFVDLDNVSISRTLDLSAAASVLLTLDYNRTNGNETINVQLWGGSSWTTVATLAGTGSVSYTLTAAQISASSAIRFISGSGGWNPSSATIYIDNVLFTTSGPYTLSCDKVYASAYSSGRKSLYELSGTTMTAVYTAPQNIGGLAISANGNAYYDNATFTSPPLYSFNGITQTNTGASVPGLIVGEAADAAGNVYYLDNTNHLRRVNVGSTGPASDLGALVYAPGDVIGPTLQYGDMAFDGNGRLLQYSSVSGSGLSYLYVIDTTTLTANNLGNVGPNGAVGVAFDGSGNLITTSNGGTTVVSVDFSSPSLAGTTIGTVSPSVYDLGSCAAPLFNPNLSANKFAENITQGQNPAIEAQSGDVLKYTIVVTNSGNFTTNSATLQDAVPTGTTYIANSTTLNGITVSDVGGNMPFVTAAEINSASQPNGVIIGGGAIATISFEVTVDPEPLPQLISNTATITYPTVVGGVTTTESVNSNTANTPINPCTNASGVDTDNDGINDVCDLDDDNDGIIDTQELCGTDPDTSILTSTIIITIDLDNGENETTWTLRDPASVLIASGGPYVDTDEVITQSILVSVSGTYTYTIFDSGGNGLNSGGGSDSNGTSGYSIDVDSNNIYTSPNWVNFGGSSIHIFDVFVPTVDPFTCLTSGPNQDDDNDGIVNYKDADYAAANGSVINTKGVLSILDLDGDGIINSMDLDSDNDGIYDLTEGGALNISGVNDSNLNGRIDGSEIIANIGDNGVYDAVETVAESGILNYTVINTDSTDNRDFLDNDSDNDGCNDVNEAGFTDNNSDGILANSPTVVNADGLVTGTSVVDGYSTPADKNSNSVYDFIESGSAPSLSTHPVNAIACPGCNAAFTVTAFNADSYQWQIFNGSIWVDLTDTGIHSDTTTNTLIITNATSADNGNQYRVIVSNTLYICHIETSNTATLTVRVNKVITNRRTTYRVNKN